MSTIIIQTDSNKAEEQPQTVLSSSSEQPPPPEVVHPDDVQYCYVIENSSVADPNGLQIIDLVGSRPSFVTTVRQPAWCYKSGAQVAPSIPLSSLSPLMSSVLENNPMIELEAVDRTTKKFTSTCHACLKTHAYATADSLMRHTKSAKHKARYALLPDLTSGNITEEVRVRTMQELVKEFPDFALVTERDLIQNEIFEYDVPPEERTLALNDLYCRFCRRKLVAMHLRFYRKTMLRHLESNKHKKEVAKAAAAEASGALRKPTKISTRIFNVDKDGKVIKNKDKRNRSDDNNHRSAGKKNTKGAKKQAKNTKKKPNKSPSKATENQTKNNNMNMTFAIVNSESFLSSRSEAESALKAIANFSG